MSKPVKVVRLELPSAGDSDVRRVANVFARHVEERSGASVTTSDPAPFRAILAVEAGERAEGFTIRDDDSGAVRIAGSSARDLLYGVGKFLRTSRYGKEGFTPSSWRGTSAPHGQFRALYCATHFLNYYEAAPSEEMRGYIEDIALWGVNTVIAHFPTWQFTGFDDPAAQKNLARVKDLHAMAKSLGLDAGLILCANQAFTTAPEAVRAGDYPDDLKRRGTHGVNCCPDESAGRQYLTELYGRLFAECGGAGLDYLVFWPYDEGGCGCDRCRPWGAQGYPRLARALTARARAQNPDVKAVLSTWCYDTPPAGEWEGLASFLSGDEPWLSCIMADAHEDFPRYPLDVGVPGGLPLVNFPEISMWGQDPWGGYGANPLPERLQRLWDQTGGKLCGGMPYSEGVYEDINKAMCYQLYWSPDKPAMETVREYVGFEFSPDVVDEMLEVVRIFEANHRREEIAESALQALELVQAVEARLTRQVRESWRWRIVYLRARIDAELFRRGGKLEGTVLKEAFDELTALYHAGNAHSMPVRPPKVE